MPFTKLNLYNGEWLDLVFDHRNKQYGAYELRQHYGTNMVKAMGITFAGIAVFVAASIIFRPHIDHTRLLDVVLPPTTKIVVPEKQAVKAELKKTQPLKSAEPVKPTTPVKTVQNLPPVVVPTDPPIEPHTTTELLKSTISNVDNNKGDDKTGNVMDKGDKGDSGTGTASVDVSVHDVGTLEVMPEPVGGAAAWAKFLQKNLRFPPVAQDNGVSGRVFLSFIIEKDGHLSNITVDKGAGYGFDEEALRVLKLAKAWKPGIQNGQPVRVKYTIPINFQLTEQ
ncbi:energy transducer TonB [Mucilaginibacter sp. SP1R1]|uniref:energy transducer TonB n=1 Tax=Mucilaginibacter sp. SP1R1 TaxID=2723091 RepID=UPI001609018C|nr:energy transducer TonB [Mucilaginibacter sp. SP1R1]MBB6148089.1 protein TonB [Mucilaginibacter sp. SP1R1]